jgi:dTDP-4-dehydrorhamnose 3,5-epimerase
MEARTHRNGSGQIIPDLLELFPKIFTDERGFFLETFHQEKLRERFESFGFSPPPAFVQDNQSFSIKGVVRGLHIQHAPHSQGKLVRVPKGRVLDVAVDLRSRSKTFGSVITVVLSDEKQNALYVPPGFLHGFAALEDSIFAYKCTDFYQHKAEAGVRWDDPQLGIDWGLVDPLVSSKDQNLPSLEKFLSKRGKPWTNEGYRG